MGDCTDALGTRQQGGFRSHVALRCDLAQDCLFRSDSMHRHVRLIMTGLDR
jgi:hypothetical protein